MCTLPVAVYLWSVMVERGFAITNLSLVFVDFEIEIWIWHSIFGKAKPRDGF